MNLFDTAILDNGIKLITRKNPNTPRIAICMFIGSGFGKEKYAGEAELTGKLLLQGTKTRNAEELAMELESNAIELNVDIKHDYIKIRALCLNEDFDKTVDLLADIVNNSTFESFDKTASLFKGEIGVELDSPKAKAADNLIKNIYPAHPYGNSLTRILEDMPKLNKDKVKDYYLSSLSSDINIVTIGNIDKERVYNAFHNKFESINRNERKLEFIKPSELKQSNTVTIAKNDAAQAQIYQGWIVPDLSHKDSITLTLLNVILGSSGLSSRLFVELRDKKGLAYTVRSTYEPFMNSGIFTVYIGTAPVNIETAIEGFNIEIKKLQEVLVSDKELEDAKNNYLGKRSFFHETNMQQAHYLGFYDIAGLGADYDRKIPEKVEKINSNDIREAANIYLSNDFVISLLAPEQYLQLHK